MNIKLQHIKAAIALIEAADSRAGLAISVDAPKGATDEQLVIATALKIAQMTAPPPGQAPKAMRVENL